MLAVCCSCFVILLNWSAFAVFDFFRFFYNFLFSLYFLLFNENRSFKLLAFAIKNRLS